MLMEHLKYKFAFKKFFDLRFKSKINILEYFK